MRNIKSKLDYLKWRLQQSSIKPSKKDLIALNDIIIALNEVSEVKRKDNSNLMKFMIHYFDSYLKQSLKNNKSNFLDFKRASQEMEEVIKMDLNSHLEKLKINIVNYQIEIMISKGELTPENLAKVSSQNDVNNAMYQNIDELINIYK
jgi:hypothetical protein